MRIRSESQLDKLKPLMGEGQVVLCKRALREGFRLWVFFSVEEVKIEGESDRRDLEHAQSRFDKSAKWVGFWKWPKPNPPHLGKNFSVSNYDREPSYQYDHSDLEG